MRRFRWNQPCAADSCWLTSPGNAAELYSFDDVLVCDFSWLARPGRKGGPGRRRACQDRRRPGLCRFFAVTRLTATGRVADAPIPASPGRSGLCLRNPVTLIDCAMHWAADHDGSPPADVCEGNPGRLFSGQGYVPVSVAAAPGYYQGPAGGGMSASTREPNRRGPVGAETGSSQCRQ